MKYLGEINKIAIPAIISNITTPILSLADMAITGHIGDAVYLAAIALGGTVFNILYWLFNFLRMGTSGPTAQAYGINDRRVMDTILWRSIVVAISIGLFLLLSGEIFGATLLRFMDADDKTIVYATQYFHICIWGAPAMMITYATNGWLIGMQDTRTPMMTAIATNLINIAASALLVFVFELKIEGVALGTCTAQWFGAVANVSAIYRKYNPHKISYKDIVNRKGLLAFFKINSDIFLRTSCLVAVTLWFTHAGAKQGVDILAANAILLQLFMLFSFFMDGYAFAGEALVGKYYGKSDNAALRNVVSTLLRIGFFFAIVFTIVYWLTGHHITTLLTDSASVISTAHRYLHWAIAIPLCGFSAFIWDGIYVGLTKTKIMLLSMAIAMLVFFIIYLLLCERMGNDGLWLAFCVYLTIRGLSEMSFSKKYIR